MLTQPPAICNDFILQLVVMLLHNLAPELSYLRLVNVTPWPLLFLNANPVINAFSCVERNVLN